MQEEGDMGKALTAECRESAGFELVRLLWDRHCRHHALAFLEKSIDNVRHGNTVSAALALIHDWVGAQPVYSPEGARETRQDILDYLQKTHDVLQILVSDIQRYILAARAASEELREHGVAGIELDVSQVKLVGNLAHQVQVQNRLDFLRFFLNDSSAELT